jgi:hypothetical protein
LAGEGWAPGDGGGGDRAGQYEVLTADGSASVQQFVVARLYGTSAAARRATSGKFRVLRDGVRAVAGALELELDAGRPVFLPG